MKSFSLIFTLVYLRRQTRGFHPCSILWHTELRRGLDQSYAKNWLEENQAEFHYTKSQQCSMAVKHSHRWPCSSNRQLLHQRRPRKAAADLIIIFTRIVSSMLLNTHYFHSLKLWLLLRHKRLHLLWLFNWRHWLLQRLQLNLGWILYLGLFLDVVFWDRL